MKRTLGTPRSRLHALGYLALGAGLAMAIASCADAPTEPDIGSPVAAVQLMEAAPPFGECVTGEQTSGALYEICLPEEQDWTGDLVVWAHGYVSPVEPLQLPRDEVAGTPVAGIITDLDYAYAATSYRDNGLIAVEAAQDLIELVDVFEETMGQPPRYSYLVGASEGALATALALEGGSSVYSGGLAACGPIGSFRNQINHFGNVRAVFDYFFPGVMPGTPIDIPASALAEWETKYEPDIRQAIANNPHAAEQLIRVTKAAVDPNDPTTVAETVVDLLWYSMFATNDAKAKLGGNPFGNRFRFYRGSDNDWRLNRSIARFTADAAALAAMEAYETTGRIGTPGVIMHTKDDPIVPFWHQQLYGLKLWASGRRLRVTSMAIPRYGHCEFTVPEVLAGFAVLVLRVSLHDLVASASVFHDQASQREFLGLARSQGANPRIVEKLVPR